MSYTGRIEIDAMALDAIHHGAGSEGNTQILRRQEISLPDGTIDTVPFISGNSIRHMIRDAGVMYALEAMDIPFESLSKGVVDLLFSGGSLGGKNAVTLEKSKRAAELFPILGVLGYSAGNAIKAGRVEVHNLHLKCDQNMYRAPERPEEGSRWWLDAHAQTSTNFGTRHDAARLSTASRYLALADANRGDAELDAKKGAKVKATKGEESTQMIYEYEVIMPGAEFFGGIEYRALKEGELDALVSALSYACRGESHGGYLYVVGAKSGTGLGRMRWHFRGLSRSIRPASMDADATLMPALSGGGSARLDAYKARLAENRAEILACLEELAA